ncbi:unnamed protein product [Plutella xylostella]|uniref:(diamondback moth) hypothetical protein n=1 Tax=Plutella xylostella TaxID=51655 RepID=A0A8S4EL99_PLUXY|nr:unnamed protein product [Plutella xylostella]
MITAIIGIVIFFIISFIITVKYNKRAKMDVQQVKEEDLKKLVNEWKESASPESEFKKIWNLYEKNKLDEGTLADIISIGAYNTKYWTQSFFRMLLPEINLVTNVSERLKIVKDILKDFDITAFKVRNLVDLSNATDEVSEKLLEAALKIVLDPTKAINDKLYVSNVLVKQTKMHKDFLGSDQIKNSFKTIALGNKDTDFNPKVFLLSYIALQCLKPAMNDLPYDFYDQFYKTNLRENIKSLSTSETKGRPIQKLDNYLESHSFTTSERFSLLETLSVIVYNGYKVDPSLFTLFDPKDWIRELLVYTLLGRSMEVDANGWNQNKVQEFMKQVHMLYAEIEKHNNGCSREKFEKFLKQLLNHQHKKEFDLPQVINILTMAQAHVAEIDTVLDETEDVELKLTHMEFVWLRKVCNERGIVYAANETNDGKTEMQKLHQLFAHYDVAIINTLLGKVKKNTRISDLIDFISLLNETQFTYYNKVVFIMNLPAKSVFWWKSELSKLIVHLLVNYENPGFKEIIYNRNLTKNMELSMESKKRFKTIYFENSDRNKFMSHFEDSFDSLKDALNSIVKTKSSLNHTKAMIEMLTKLSELIHHGNWSIERVAMILHCLDTPTKMRELAKTIEIILEFNVEEGKDINEILKSSKTLELYNNVYECAMKQYFTGTYEKDNNELLNEINTLNKSKNISFLSRLSTTYDEVQKAYTNSSEIVTSSKAIQKWNSTDVKEWTTAIKNDLKSENPKASDAEKIAVIMRTVKLSVNIEPRPIQIMSVLLLLNPASSKGRLAQINTGEGKTTIIAMIAAFHGLHNLQVDIVTTSPVLAVPQCRQLEGFYETLGLTVSHNFNNPDGYKSDICYGPLLDFEADVLRDECSLTQPTNPLKRRRRGRRFDIVIADEVDSMFIDGNDHIVRLSGTMPGMNHLETLLAAIVLQINSVAGCIKQENGTAYLLQPKSRINEDGSLATEEEVDAIPLDCTVREFIRDATEKHIRKLVRDIEAEEGYPEVQIPNHLREFVCKIQIPKWISSGINAKYAYEDTKHYVIKKGKIMPVDANNTGVVQENQHWSNGIHQFLQFKHGAKLYPESLTNNYISNVGFFRRYGKKIYGLTGTLGDEKSCEFLEKVYDVDTVIIPPFKKKQHVQLEPAFAVSDELWRNKIVDSCISKLKQGRAVLIITKYIKEIDQLNKRFNDLQYDKSKIILFKTDDDTHVVEKLIKPGEVILTTNIAGRGTDIKLDKAVDEKGGLHVCLTFLPINTRVEQQNVGRTSRTGNRGTSQLILLNQERDIKEIKRQRDEKQNNAIAEAEKAVEVVITKEMVFAKFLNMLKNDIKGRSEHKKIDEAEAVQERFALWLKLNDKYIDEESRENVLSNFDKFKRDVISDDGSNTLIKNPYFYVQIGNKLLKESSFDLAIKEFSEAIKLDGNFAEHAYYNRAYCLVARYGENMSGNRYYIDDAIGDFKKARQLIQKRQADLHLIQRASDAENFSQQVQHKMNLYNIQKQAIDLAIGPDKNEIDEQIKSLTEKLKSVTDSDEKKEIEEQIKFMKDNRKQDGVIEDARGKERNVKIELMALSDCLPENDMELYTEEIEEHKKNGFIGGFKITEIKPIDWLAVFGLLVLGLGQLIAGAALAVYTLGSGATLAMNLITEGISDIITAVKDGIINRDFSWASWAIQKAISITISVVCAGMSAIKDVASTCASGAKMVGQKVVNETVKGGFKLVAKKVAVELSKGIAKEIVGQLADYGIEKTLMPQIQSKLIEMIEGPLREALINNEYIKAMLEKDMANKNSKYEDFIKKTAFNLLDTTCKSKLLNIASQIGTGIADNKIKGFSAARKVTEALLAVDELVTLVPDLVNKLNEKVEAKAKKDKLMEQKSENSKNDVKENSENPSSEQTKTETENQQTTHTQNESDIEMEEDINLKQDPQVQVEAVKREINPSILHKYLVKSVSSKMLATIKGKMINPVVQAGVNYGMDKITSGLDATLNHDIENYKALKRNIHYQNKGYTKPSISKSDTSNIDESDPKIKKAKQIIEDAEAGGKSGLNEMGAISDETNRPIEVYDEKGRLKFTIGDTKTGKPMKVQYHKDAEHYTMLGGKEPKSKGKGDNMCLYNVISEQCGKDPNSLKKGSLDRMRTNIVEFSKQSADIARLEMYDGLKLCMGGAKTYDDTLTAEEAGRIIDESHGAEAEINPKYAKRKCPPGHPRGHVVNPDGKVGVHEYSKQIKGKKDNVKCAFNSIEIQNKVAKKVLSHPRTKAAIDQLNDTYRQELVLTREELNLELTESKSSKWINGEKDHDFEFSEIKIVLGNKKGKRGDKDADVLITSLFPEE